MKLVLRDNYPEPTLRNRNGWYLCQVNVPTGLFYIYGKDNKIRRSLKTSDEGVANRKLWKAANEIYDEFDRKQIEFAEAQEANAKKEERQLDDVELSDDGYTKVTQKKSLGYGWEATLYNNDRLVLTQDATGETLSIPPESTQTLRDIFKSIKKET